MISLYNHIFAEMDMTKKKKNDFASFYSNIIFIKVKEYAFG